MLIKVCSISTDGASEHLLQAANQARIDAEDGEIDDAKMTDAPRANEATNQKDALSQVAQATANLAIEQAQQMHSQPADDPPKGVSRSQTPKPAGIKPESGVVSPAAAPPSLTPALDPKPILSTNAGLSPSVPPRPESSRSSSASAVNGRLPHTLPSRPEPPYSRGADNRMLDRVNERGMRDHSRDNRYPDRTSSERPRDLIQERLGERHVSGAQPRSHELPPERSYNSERNRSSSNWGAEQPANRPSVDDRHSSLGNRESRPPPREEKKEWSHRDRSFGESNNVSRTPEMQGPPSRDQAMAPPRSSISHHPDRAALISGGQDREKALFNTPHSERRHEGNRSDRHANTGRSSRGVSPSRLENRRTPHQEGHYEDRQPSDIHHAPSDPSYGHPARYDSNHLPTGPRTDRNGAPSSHDRFRESSRNGLTAPPANEQSRRPTHESNYVNRQQESQYGRLNPGPENSAGRVNTNFDVPSGPRLPNGNNAPATRANGRNFSGAFSQSSHQQTQHPPATPNNAHPVQDRQTPTGPSSRAPPRNSLPMPRLDTTQPTPATQASESPDTAGVHPDRLKAIQGAVTAPPGNVQPSPSNMGRPPRPPLPPVSVAPMPNPSPHGQMPSPGGPNASPVPPVSANHGPSPTARGPPTGPSSTNDRSRGDRRMFAGLQNVLQQAGTPNNLPERSGQGASIRGRGGRANNMPMHSPVTSGPPTPSIPRPEQSRGDLFSTRHGGPPAQIPGEEDGAYGRGARRGPMRDATRDFSREAAREGERDMTRDNERERELMRDEGREGERRSGRLRNGGDEGRDAGHGSSMSMRDEDRMPRRDDARERGNGRAPIPPPTERDLRRPPRGDEPRRADSERRGMEGWGQEPRAGPDRRDDRDRRDSGRKRGRAGDDGRMQDEKRQRRVN